MVTPTGLLVSKHDDRSAAFVFNSQAELSHTNANFNQRSHYHRRKRNSWPLATLDEWPSSYAASCGTLTSHKKPQPLLTKITTECTAMGNAQKPTPRTRHIDIKYFALCDWIERDLIHLERIDTSINISDHLTKSLPRILFHRHADYLLGHIPPKYSPIYQHAITTYGDKLDYDRYIPDSFTTPITAAAARIYAPILEDIKGNPWLRILWHD